MENINDENDITEEENRSNINKINISYIGKYKTIEQIEKKIEGENAINRIIINNLFSISSGSLFYSESKSTSSKFS